jgi:hypothetical protein
MVGRSRFSLPYLDGVAASKPCYDVIVLTYYFAAT